MLSYNSANRERVKTENPEAKFGDIVSILIRFLSFRSHVHFKSVLRTSSDSNFCKPFVIFKAKILSKEYKALPETEKKQWEDLAEKDKERYKREMEDYEPPSDDSDDDGKRRKKKKKDPNAPKRNQSAFFIYSNTHRATVKEENPEATFGGIAKIISKQFKALSEKDRAKYDKLALEDKERYQREMAAYKGA